MYNNAPQSGLASLVASPYADSDVMNVQMTPREVAGLQQLAMSYGAREEDLYDPVTGQPKFSFLKKILPMIAGAILPGIPGVGAFAKTIGFGNQALGSALLVGGVTGLVEGDLKKGLMAGLGAYSGAKIGEAFTAAGTPAAPAPATAPPPTPSLKDTGFNISTSPIDQAASGMPLSAARELPVSGITGRTMVPFQTVTQAPALPLPDVSQAAAAPPAGFFGTMGQGVRNVLASGEAGDASRKAFGDVFSNPISRYATMFGIAGALTPDQKPLSVPGMGEDIMYIPGGMNPQYGTGANQPYMLPGQYYKRTAKGLVPYNPYQKAPGYATGGPVQAPDQDMNQQRALPHQYQQFPYPNQNYPLSTVTQGNYSSSAPQPREVLGGYEVGIDPYTGEEKFAEGGTADTKPDAFVEANRKYVEELNRRAMNPTFTPYGMVASGGLGGTNAPWTGTNPYGGSLNTTTGTQQQPTGGTDPVTGILAAYGAQQGAKALLPYATRALGAFGIGPGALTGVTATGLVPGTAAHTAAMAQLTGVTPTGLVPGTTAANAASTSGTAAASGLKGGATAAGTAAAAAAALIGAHQAYQGISKGREGQAAAGGALAGAGGAYLAGASGLGGAGLTSLAGFGPIGLAAAAIAAIGASLVNTKEMGDVALRNYWNAVDQGRGIGQTPSDELALGFINFYRTNKNEFAGQAKYGRTGNSDFIYDMTQVINNAVKEGKIAKDVDAATMYKQVVQPWLNTMGSGPKDEKARAIQDFMMTDIINNFMQGKNIDWAQVKNDKKFKTVSERPVYAGVPTTQQKTPAAKDANVRQAIETYGSQQGGFPSATNPYGETMGFADGGAIGDDYNFGFAGGGMSEYKAGGKLLDGPGDGMSDDIPAVIRGKGVQRAALADGEFVVPADVVSHLGNGSTKAGAKKLYAMMDRVRQARTGKTRQAPAVKADRLLPA